MKYAVDRIEEEIVVLENLSTKEIKEVNKKLLPSNTKEGNILIEDNNKYIIDKDEEEKRRQILKEKLNILK